MVSYLNQDVDSEGFFDILYSAGTKHFIDAEAYD